MSTLSLNWFWGLLSTLDLFSSSIFSNFCCSSLAFLSYKPLVSPPFIGLNWGRLLVWEVTAETAGILSVTDFIGSKFALFVFWSWDFLSWCWVTILDADGDFDLIDIGDFLGFCLSYSLGCTIFTYFWDYFCTFSWFLSF